MRYLILLLLFISNEICFGDELPIVKFPNKEEINKLKIKELIKELDANSKEELPKEEPQKEDLKENLKEKEKPLQQVVPNSYYSKLRNTPTVNKSMYYAKPTYYNRPTTRSRTYCPT